MSLIGYDIFAKMRQFQSHVQHSSKDSAAVAFGTAAPNLPRNEI
jgi:hypothetical protein